MLEQRYHDVMAYQREIRDESARQRLAQLGRSRRAVRPGRIDALVHGLDRWLSGHAGGRPRPQPPSVRPVH